MKQFKEFVLLFMVIIYSLNVDAQLNKFMVQCYFEEGLHNAAYPPFVYTPWRDSDLSIRDSFFIDLCDNMNFNNVLIDNLSYWKKPRNYESFYMMAKNAGLSTIIVNDSLYSKCDQYGICHVYPNNPFNYEKAYAFLEKASNNNYNIIGFQFSDEPRTIEEEIVAGDTNAIELIPPYSNIVYKYNPNLLRYANLSPVVNSHSFDQSVMDIKKSLYFLNLLSIL
jgi:hypothetical protein